ncbi:MAG TPA: epoxide hydrolase [Thermoanaerobaculia bacterium]|nr:epoxide hydrolase [Thermoanaerobaculia bacterium]
MTAFEIDFGQAAIDDLRDRLRRTRWPDAIAGAGWSYGIDIDVLRPIVNYWAESFDFEAQQRRLNAFHHYRANGIHYIHERGVGPRPLPLLITHGWPGTFAEMLALIPLLTDPASHGGNADDAFDVVVPSIPGFGFSDRPSMPDMGTFRVAELFSELMRNLGYARYGVQGGDFGASISTRLAWKRPDEIIGMHLNYIPGSYAPSTLSDPPNQEEQAFIFSTWAWESDHGAYAHLQKKTPQTAAVPLNDSPAGLAAWILEKSRDWADCEGDITRLSIDELLLNVTIYWMTETIGSSMRLYLEQAKNPFRFWRELIHVPCGIARFPREEPFPPRRYIERVYNVVHWTEMPRGGHFAAMEEPQLLAEDIRKFFRAYRT